MGKGGICCIPEPLHTFLRQAIVTYPLGIFLASKVQDDVIHGLFDLRIVGECFMSEACRIAVRQFLSDGSEILLWVCKLLLGAICKGHPAYRLFLIRQLLLPLVVAIQVRLVITGTGGAAQTVAVTVCLHHIAEAAPVLGDSPAVLGAEATHRRQILQWSIRPEGIHDGLKFIFELRDIELILVVGPPGVPEFLSVVTEVHSDMPHGTQCLVLFHVQFRIEKARLLKGSGPQLDSVFTCSYSALIHGFHLLSLVSTQHTTPCRKYLLHFHHPRICSEFAAINVTSLVPVRGCHALPDFE